jgi:MOSC domain-containing protein YiiM
VPEYPFILSIQTGVRQELGMGGADAARDAWTTAIFKTPIDRPVFVRTGGLEGDEQADLVNHGGRDKAVCAYSADHYAAWAPVFSSSSLEAGAFGENVTVSGLTEADVCIGDVWMAGDLVLQVSQPRQPCWKLARKWHMDHLPKLVVESGRTGWYFRVIHEGLLTRGTALVLRDRPAGDWTINDANRVMHGKPFNKARAAVLAEVEGLSASWRDSLRRKSTS